MGGIEVIAITVIFITGIIGLTRGPAKELGVTMALFLLLALLGQFGNLVDLQDMPLKINNVLATLGLDSSEVMKQRIMVVFFFGSILVLTAFMAYHGQDTLAFRFKGPPGIVGSILGFLIGAFNGYLIVGSLWYYLDRMGYPIQIYPWFEARFTETAARMVSFLPQYVASPLILSAAALILLWWRILK